MASLEIGTSTSTSTSITLGSEYEVFLNFRGPDTRWGFTNLLYCALENLGIHVFIDDENLRPGEIIGDNLVRAIDDSKVYIPIFSKTYASSKWCLRELAKMVENIPKSKEEGKEKIILPIFYDVKPDDLKLETGLYCKDVSKLEQEMNDQKKDVSDVPKWRKALQDVCCAEGWERGQFDSDQNLIELIVKKVVVILKIRQKHVTKDSVGMADRKADIYNLLEIDSNDVRIIWIYGMGGVGKTTLAKTIFNELCPKFGRHCSFLEDIRGRNLQELKEVLVSDVCHFGMAGKVDDKDRGINMIQEAIYNKKVLIVLDDVDNYLQVEQLIGQKHLYPGTRILVTARDVSVLEKLVLAYEVKPYYMKGLRITDALELFSRHAFDDRSPPEDYYDLSLEIVSTTGGLPLALELIGSLLFREENKEVWNEKLKKLRKTSHDDVLGKLRISYDALDKGEKEIFLDIACFFVGEEKTYQMCIWEDSGFLPKDAINVLTGRFMIRVTDNKFWMHSLLRDLGRKIVKDENQGSPGMRSRLWAKDDVIHALKSTETKGNVRALRLRVSFHDSDRFIAVTSEEIGRFPQLRFLWLTNVICQGDFTDKLSELKWIDWQTKYNIPPRPNGNHQWFQEPYSLHLEKVVVVKLIGLDLTEYVFKNLIKEAINLKVLILSCNTLIHGTLSFPENSALEKLAISDFFYLTEIDRSIEKLKVLTDLSFERCVQLQKLPRQIGRLRGLQHLSLKFFDLTELPDSLWRLKLLTKLDVSCTDIARLPDNIGELSSLSSVDASFTEIEKLPSAMSELPKLQTLRLDRCDRIQELPKLPRSLTTLRLSSKSLLTVPNLSDLPDLVELAISDRSQSSARSHTIETCDLQWIKSLSKLEKLYFCFSNVYAPTTELCSLSLLKELTLHGLDVPTFQQLPSDLIVLELYDTRGKEVHLNKIPPSEMENEFVPSSSTKSMEQKLLKQLEREFIYQNDLSKENVRLRKELGCNELQAPELIGHWRGDFLLPSPLGKLQKFVLWGCPDVQEIQFDSSSEYLFVVSVAGCASLKRLGGLSKLNFLEEITLKQCPSLQVVEGIDELRFLHKLEIHECGSMQRIFHEQNSEIPDKCQISISCSGELHDSRLGRANDTVNWESYKNAPDPEAEAEAEVDSEPETEDPSRNTGVEDGEIHEFFIAAEKFILRRPAMVQNRSIISNQENEERESEPAEEGLYIDEMVCWPENYFRDDHKEEEEQRKKSWTYYS